MNTEKPAHNRPQGSYHRYSALVLALLAQSTAHALTYGFEDENSEHGGTWTPTSSAVSIVPWTAEYGVAPTEGIYQSYITGEGTNASNLKNFFGLTSTSDLGSHVSDGAGLKLSSGFAAKAGDFLLFDWRFEAGDVLDEYRGNDFAFVVLDGNVYKLADVASVFNEEEGLGIIGYVTAKIQITSSNPIHQLGFGVVNVGDHYNPSWLYVDNVRIQYAHNVPESGPGLRLLTAIGFIAHLIRRRYDAGSTVSTS